jgi:hypothetical protein
MATITPVQDSSNQDFTKITWSNIADGDTILPFAGLSEYADRSVQVDGDDFDGATVRLKGSNDQVSFYNMNDPLGNVLAFTAAGLMQVLEYTDHVKPFTTGGGGSQSVNVTLIAKRTRS